VYVIVLRIIKIFFMVSARLIKILVVGKLFAISKCMDNN